MTMIISYTVPEIRCVTDVTVVFYSGLFFALLPLSQLKKSKFQKNKQTKKSLEISSFYTCVPKMMIR